MSTSEGLGGERFHSLSHLISLNPKDVDRAGFCVGCKGWVLGDLGCSSFVGLAAAGTVLAFSRVYVLELSVGGWWYFFFVYLVMTSQSINMNFIKK